MINKSFGLRDRVVGLARKFAINRIALPHFMAFFRYSSVKRLRNLIQVEIDIRLGRIKPSGKPFIMFLEVNNICNLKCPFCLTGKGTVTDRPKRNMTFEEMKGYIDPISDYLYFIQLYNWGEPLLNKDLARFINYANKRRIFTMLSSNMNFSRPGVATEIVTSGLDYFIAAIDGFSPETYSKYRRGGNFNKVKKNLLDVLAAREKQGNGRPFIEWQFVVFRHNENEIEAAESFARENGVDFFHPIPGYIEDPTWITTRPEFKAQLGRPDSVKKCTRPWTHINIRSDGGAASCCYEYLKEDDYGNYKESLFDEIWYNDQYVVARDILSKGLDKGMKKPVTICHRCLASGIRPSFETLHKVESDQKRL